MTLGLSNLSEYTSIPLGRLFLDEQNPRLAQPSNGQYEAIRSLAHIQGRKLQMLAKDIVEHGLNPSDLSIVMPFGLNTGQYVVLDGNRRIAALKILENPSIVSDAVEPRVMNAMVKLASQFAPTPEYEVQCIVVAERSQANHWIELRNTGEHGGAGSVRWGSDEIDRHRTRNGGQANYATQVLDFLENRGTITPELRQSIATTSLNRICGTTEIRPKLGLEQANGVLHAVGDIDKVEKALTHIVTEIAEQRLPVSVIYTKNDRMTYANNLPPEIVVDKTVGIDDAPTLQPASDSKPPSQQQTRLINIPPPRARLIPEECVLNVTDYRVRDIEVELRTLNLNRHPNAIAVLFRVFLELSLDLYIQKYNIAIPDKRVGLGVKLEKAAADLGAKQKLTQKGAAPARRAAARNSFLGPSVTLMHQWVHNQHTSPTANELRSHWNDLQPFITALWSP